MISDLLRPPAVLAQRGALDHLRSPVRSARAARARLRAAARGAARRGRRAAAGAAAALGRPLVPAEHLCVLDGATLNLCVPVSEEDAAAADSVRVEFVRGRRRRSGPAELHRPAPGRQAEVRAWIDLRGRDRTAAAPVPLTRGRWRVRLVLSGPGGVRRLPPAAPDPPEGAAAGPLAGGGAGPSARLEPDPTGAAAVRIAPVPARADVQAVRVRPHAARVEGVLVGVPAGRPVTAEAVLTGGRTAHPVRTAFAPDPDGRRVRFDAELPVAAMAGTAAGELRWELRFRVRGRSLRAGCGGTGLHRPDTAMRLPARTVFPDGAPPALLRPRYTRSGVLSLSVTPLPPGA